MRPIYGRYTAVFDERSIAYNSSFFGISFLGRKPALAHALAAIMHSRLIAYQLALMGGNGRHQTDQGGGRGPRRRSIPTDRSHRLDGYAQTVQRFRHLDKTPAICLRGRVCRRN